MADILRKICEQGREGYLRLTANPYTIITQVTQDNVAITPIHGTADSPGVDECGNYNSGYLNGTYDMGSMNTSSTQIVVTTEPYQYKVIYHRHRGPNNNTTETIYGYYGQNFTLQATTIVSRYVFVGWAIGSESNEVFIPSTITTAVLNDANYIDTIAHLLIPTLYPSPSLELHLYAKWKLCRPVTVYVDVTDGSPITANIAVGQ